ncbi:DUF3618 domain-containing protein [Actinoplanes sp. NPDC023801]|uniref:DUF3618 domain-containing protein n=1 Tax=Actinoplanes sp. NPDC023801 TaxID=3154595 RepID=UPI0033E768C3
MAEEPERLRQDIEITRASLTRDVDLLAEKASPGRIAQRRWNSVKDRVMGSADHVRQVAGDSTSSARSTVQDGAAHLGEAAGAVRGVPRAAVAQTQGNPLAAGIIAFGAGMLAATLIPVSDTERRAGQQLRDGGGDLTDKVKDLTADIRDDLAGTVEHAVDEIKSTARDAASTSKKQVRSSAQQAKQSVAGSP